MKIVLKDQNDDLVLQRGNAVVHVFNQLKGVVESDFWVDMGLPSGLLWAKANIDLTTNSKFQEVNGAISPYTYEGSFFSWGNTDGHNPVNGSFDISFDAETYASTPGAQLTGDIPLSYDAAAVNCGAPWRMPSTEEFAELLNNIDYVDANGDVISDTNKLVTIDGIVGIRLKSKNNGNILFFPCSGDGIGQSLEFRGSDGDYWSRSLDASNMQVNALSLGFYYGGVTTEANRNRSCGLPIRPVQ